MELLISVAIISLLSSIVLASIQGVRKNARYTTAQQEMNQMRDVIIRAQGNAANSLKTITNDGCTDCPHRNDGTTEGAINALRESMIKIYKAANVDTSTLNEGFLTDPWGNAYGLDENENPKGSSCNRPDTLASYGPDHARGGGDDIRMELPVAGACL